MKAFTFRSPMFVASLRSKTVAALPVSVPVSNLLLWFDPTDSSQRATAGDGSKHVVDKATAVADNAGVTQNTYALLNGAAFATVGGVTAVTTDGVNDYVGDDSNDSYTVDRPVVQNLNGAFTWAVWVYPTSGSTYNDLMGQGNGASVAGHYITIMPESTYNRTIQVVGPNASWKRSSIGVTLNQWNLIVYTKTSDASLPRTEQMYINNSSATFLSGAGDPDDPSDSSSQTLIGSINYNGAYTRGTKSLGEIFVYKEALSTADINNLWNSTKGKYGL
jgi:hypothetical protein